MGVTFSMSLTAFEVLNEAYIAISGGFLGLVVLTSEALRHHKFAGPMALATITISSIVYVCKSNKFATTTVHKVIFITGCDSGLGFSLAQHACEMGFTVIAGFLSLESDGAHELRRLFGRKVQHVEIDITRSTSVEVAVEVIEAFFKNHTFYKLWAVVNNAGVMVFGEFEWLTQNLIEKQITVNFIGTLKVSKAFCPLLRQYKARIITITSHCALATLPGLSVYGATKAALMAWNDGLRVEMSKYGVSVVVFIPGSFILQSNIMARQVEYCYEMHSAFTVEQRKFYGDYFKRYNSYLSVLSGTKVAKKVDDPKLYRRFEEALLQVPPKTLYLNEPFKYKAYHFMFKYSPVWLRDYLVVKFMKMPQFENKPLSSCVSDVLAAL